jgi:hypothetical protein
MVLSAVAAMATDIIELENPSRMMISFCLCSMVLLASCSRSRNLSKRLNSTAS